MSEREQERVEEALENLRKRAQPGDPIGEAPQTVNRWEEIVRDRLTELREERDKLERAAREAIIELADIAPRVDSEGLQKVERAQDCLSRALDESEGRGGGEHEVDIAAHPLESEMSPYDRDFEAFCTCGWESGRFVERSVVERRKAEHLMSIDTPNPSEGEEDGPPTMEEFMDHAPTPEVEAEITAGVEWAGEDAEDDGRGEQGTPEQNGRTWYQRTVDWLYSMASGLDTAGASSDAAFFESCHEKASQGGWVQATEALEEVVERYEGTGNEGIVTKAKQLLDRPTHSDADSEEGYQITARVREKGLRPAIVNGLYYWTDLDPHDDERWVVDAIVKAARKRLSRSDADPSGSRGMPRLYICRCGRIEKRDEEHECREYGGSVADPSDNHYGDLRRAMREQRRLLRTEDAGEEVEG